ncbi:RidA family protein [Paraburkholderia sp. MM5477-R1]|uniref:RidA family protein n=1 Tax=Paraburkholderia sp. MM5477-R1 TaxID=2991062 RepID=UPI003D1C5C82
MIAEIRTDAAPNAVGPYSQAIRSGELLFVSGQLPIDPATGQFPSDNVEEQAHQCLRNLAAIAKAADSNISKTLRTTVLLADLRDFSVVNEVYAKYFDAPYPARCCYEVKGLPRGAKVEIEAVVAVGT